MLKNSVLSRVLPAFVIAAGVAAVSASCSAGRANIFNEGGGGSGSGTGATGNQGLGGDLNLGAGTVGGAAPDAGSTACAAEPHQAMQVPLDMFVMLDQSGSMSDSVSGGGTKWTAVTGALTSFLQQPGLGGISVGIQYFGLPPGGAQQCSGVPFCATDADCGGTGCGPCFFGICVGGSAGGDSCDAADYSGAAVEIAPLPGVAAPIIASMGQHGPTTSTPTSAALQGGINHCKAWAGKHPGHVVVHVFATDGDPSECDTNLNNINAIAAAGANSGPKVLTFVIGVGSSLSALNGIAKAGGTNSAYLVDTGGNSQQQFLQALNAIRGAALGCQYNIPVPASGQADYGRVNVQYTPGNGGNSQVFYHYPDKASCPPGGDGWYYDDNAKPTLINLCDATCDKVGADVSGKIDILLGCQTAVPQ